MNMSRKISLFYNMEKKFKFYPRLVNYKGKGQHSGTVTRRELEPSTPCKKMIFKQSTNTLLDNSINTCQQRIVEMGGGQGEA